MKINVTAALMELNGKTPLTQEEHCAGCINVYQKIHNLLSLDARVELSSHEKEISEIVTKKLENITPYTVMNRALTADLPDDEAKSELLIGRWLLATRIFNASEGDGEVEITTKEAVEISDRVAIVYKRWPMIAAQVCHLLAE